MFTSKCHLCRPNGNGMVAVKTTCNRLWGAILWVFKESVVNFTACLYLTALWVTKIHDVYNITIAMNWPWLQDKDAVETTASQEHAYPCPLKPLLLQRGLQGSTYSRCRHRNALRSASMDFTSGDTGSFVNSWPLLSSAPCSCPLSLSLQTMLQMYSHTDPQELCLSPVC